MPGGTWSGTDNAAKLTQLRADIAGKAKSAYQLYFKSSGTVLSSYNKWLIGVINADVFGNNTTFRSLTNSADESFHRPFYSGSMFQDNALTYSGSVSYTSPVLFNTVSAGASSLTLTTASEVTSFSVGNRVFIYAYDHTGFGYPPGDRYFEWHEIQSIAPGGVITLARPIVNNYSSLVWDVPNITGSGVPGSSGRPRMINLDRPNYTYPKHIGFHDVNFGYNTGGGSGNVIFAAEDLVLERCGGDGYFWPSEDRYATYRKCKLNDTEFDKLVDVVTLEDPIFQLSPNAGGSINTIKINGGQAGESTRLNSRYIDPRNYTLRGNTQPDAFASALNMYPGAAPVRQMNLDNLRFSSTAANVSEYHINVAPFHSITVGAVSASSSIVPFVNSFSDASSQIKDKAEAGITRLFRDDGSKGGLITSVTWDGTYNANQGAYIVSGNWGRDVVKTGSVTTTSGSNAVSGSGTSFLADFQVGKAITSGSNYLGVVASINSNTSITLKANTVSVVSGGPVSQSNAPRVGEVWKWSYVKNIIDEGNHMVTDGKPLWHGESGRFAGNRGKGVERETRMTKKDFKLNGEYVLTYNGFLTEIEVNVTKPYTGTSTSTILSMYTVGDFTEVMRVNLMKTGRRKIDQFVSYPTTPIGGDNYTLLNGQFVKQLNIYYVNAASQQLTDFTPDTIPDFEFVIKWREFGFAAWQLLVGLLLSVGQLSSRRENRRCKGGKTHKMVPKLRTNRTSSCIRLRRTCSA